jgi:hypothetical protein
MTPFRFAATAVAITALAAAFAAVPDGTQASADETAYLENFAGDWRGDGTFRRSPRHDAEPVVCRASGSMNGNGQLEIHGRCGGEGFTGSFRVYAAYDAQNARYAALFAGPPSIGSSELAGQRQDDRIELAVDHPDQPPSTLLIARQSDTAFRIRSETAHAAGQSFVSADIQLRRQ